MDTRPHLTTPDPTDAELDAIHEASKDDRFRPVGSDIRVLVGCIRRLRWRSVVNDPPPSRTEVLVRLPSGLLRVMERRQGKQPDEIGASDYWTEDNDYHDGDAPVWWMPIPEGP